MLREMAALQDDYNSLLYSDWRARKLPFSRAIWVECAELMEHVGWKWWKAQAVDGDQARLELIDIWHFGLSLLMIRDRVDVRLAQRIDAHMAKPDCIPELAVIIDALARRTLADADFALDEFLLLCRGLNWSLPDLYHGYVGKNILNRFRLDHGYREGTYRKIWAGYEDNLHLLALAANLGPVAGEDFRRKLYQALAERYEQTRREQGPPIHCAGMAQEPEGKAGSA